MNSAVLLLFIAQFVLLLAHDCVLCLSESPLLDVNTRLADAGCMQAMASMDAVWSSLLELCWAIGYRPTSVAST